MNFLVSVWQKLQPNELLYGGSPSAFRRRWDATLAKIGVGPQHKLTPGSLRGGGAVVSHRHGMPIADLLWRMKLQNVKTLTFYLQETTAMSISSCFATFSKTTCAVTLGLVAVVSLPNEAPQRTAVHLSFQLKALL